MQRHSIPGAWTACSVVVFLALSALVMLGRPAGASAQDGEAADGQPSIVTKTGLEIYGYIEGSYTQNFNNPSNNINQLRGFDPNAQSFRPNMAQVVLERVAKGGGSASDRAGFRIKLDFGLDSQFTGGTLPIDPNQNPDDFDFQETYVHYVAPIGNGLDLKFGRMNTLVGFEVIESPFNVNFSRSWLFSFGQPFTVTGVRASYQLTPEVFLAVGGVNSFEGNVVDTNRGKSVEWLVGLTPSERFGATFYGIWGPEQPTVGAPTQNRILGGGFLTWEVTDRFSTILEAYYANEEGANQVIPGKNARWDGVAGYFIYDVTNQWSLRLRGQLWEDAGGFRACTGGPSIGNANVCFAGVAPVAQTLWGPTVTLQYQPTQALITRLEFRYDKSNKNVFQYGTRATNNQETLALDVIYVF